MSCNHMQSTHMHPPTHMQLFCSQTVQPDSAARQCAERLHVTPDPGSVALVHSLQLLWERLKLFRVRQLWNKSIGTDVVSHATHTWTQIKVEAPAHTQLSSCGLVLRDVERG